MCNRSHKFAYEVLRPFHRSWPPATPRFVWTAQDLALRSSHPTRLRHDPEPTRRRVASGRGRLDSFVRRSFIERVRLRPAS